MASSKKSSETTAPRKAATSAKSATAEKPKAAAKPKAVGEKPAAKSLAKKAAPAKPQASKPASTAATKRKASKKAAASVVSAEQRHHYIEVAAYHIAERRGFHGGNAADDWAQAEKEIDRLLAEGLLNTPM